jgi:uncharacterized membrane protein
MDRYIHNPFTLLALVFFAVLALLVLPLVILGIIGGAFANLGFSWGTAFLILFATLAGSFVNIPLTTLTNRIQVYEEEFVPFVQILYRIPLPAERTTLSINVGGALIPLLISVYILFESIVMTASFATAILALVGVAFVTVVAHLTSRVVPGLGIVTPVFIPPLAALLCGLALSVPLGAGGMAAPVIAYTSGTLGVLIGADLLNLNRVGDMAAPMVSIGGAGTFDGIFLAGVIAAFLA